MKKNGLTYVQIISIALLAELTLMVLQLIYFKIYAGDNAGSGWNFTSDYMKTRGFYIFQIIGFFLYTFVSYVAAGRMHEKIIKKAIVLLVTGGIIELSFYLVMQADYEGAFLFSILDKVIAVTFGLILYNYTAKKVNQPEDYL